MKLWNVSTGTETSGQQLWDAIGKKDTLIKEQKTLLMEKNTLIEEQKTLLMEKNTLIEEQKTLLMEKNALIGKKMKRIEGLEMQHELDASERETLNQKLWKTIGEKDTLIKELESKSVHVVALLPSLPSLPFLQPFNAASINMRKCEFAC
jgi:hypothetical protein